MFSKYKSTVEELIEDARNGRMFILVDDEDRENEGDLVIPAQMATPDVINFMAKHGRGLICLALTRERVEKLGLPLLPQQNSSRLETAFTVSIEAREGVTTGISAPDRARTVAVAIDSATGAGDIATPGHVFPLVARDGGVDLPDVSEAALLAELESTQRLADTAVVLLDQGADVNAKNRLDGKTALHIVAWGALTDFMELLIANGADLNAQDNYGRTALHYAAQFGHTKAAKLLVAKGANLDIQDLHFGKTPLHWGVEWGTPDRWEVIDLLIAKGAALNVKNNFAMTPLDYAIKNGRTELAASLRKHGAKPGG